MIPRDLNIVKACLNGKRAAQRQLYDKYKVFLFGVCMRYAHSKHEAEDILQEGFFRILKDLHQYSQRAPLQAWMRRVMVNSALMHIRKYHKLKHLEFEEKTVEQLGQLDNSLIENDRAQFIIQLIRQLPLIHQTVFNLRAMDGYTFREISELLEIPEATLRSHYLRARAKLQFLLQKEFN